MTRTASAIRAAAFASLAILASGSIATAQAPAAADVAVKTTDLGNRTYMLEGMGGNVTIALADDGIFMVDAQFANMHDKLKAAIAALSPLPVKYVINTHFHGDHTGGDALFAQDGATIVAQDNVRKRLAAGSVNGLNGQQMAPMSGTALPTKTYKRTLTLKLKGRTAQLKYFPNAHTDGDTYIYFADANVLSTGDIVTLGNRYPNIDFANGGGINGMIKGVDTYLKLANDQTKIVPGHGPLTDKKGLVAYRAMLIDARQRVRKLIAQHKSETDAVNAHPFADIETKIGANEQASANFVRVIYNSLKPAKATAKETKAAPKPM